MAGVVAVVVVGGLVEVAFDVFCVVEFGLGVLRAQLLVQVPDLHDGLVSLTGEQAELLLEGVEFERLVHAD